MLTSKLSLATTASGHYCIPIYSMITQDNSLSKGKITLTVTDAFRNNTPAKKRSKSKKLHIQLAHASKERLLKFITDTGLKDKLFKKEIENVCDVCELCKKYKKAPLKPIVGLPIAKVFDYIVCMDLKDYIPNKTLILHLIDSSTRYSAAHLIQTKKDE